MRLINLHHLVSHQRHQQHRLQEGRKEGERERGRERERERERKRERERNKEREREREEGKVTTENSTETDEKKRGWLVSDARACVHLCTKLIVFMKDARSCERERRERKDI